VEGEIMRGAQRTLEQVAAGRCSEEETEIDVNESAGGVEKNVAVVTVLHGQNATNNTASGG
jgi:hypothetical protein